MLSAVTTFSVCLRRQVVYLVCGCMLSMCVRACRSIQSIPPSHFLKILPYYATICARVFPQDSTPKPCTRTSTPTILATCPDHLIHRDEILLHLFVTWEVVGGRPSALRSSRLTPKEINSGTLWTESWVKPKDGPDVLGEKNPFPLTVFENRKIKAQTLSLHQL